MQVYPLCNHFFQDTNACASSWLALEQAETRNNICFLEQIFREGVKLHSLPLIKSR